MDRKALHQRYEEVRRRTERLCEPLETEDYVVQSMPDASPVKWNLGHTTWFFETFVLGPHLEGWKEYRSGFEYIFNSYYDAVGPQLHRPSRGLLSRPTVQEVFRYRSAVDSAVHELVDAAGEALLATVAPLIEVGTHHEEQHQELLLTDLKHALAQNPLSPIYVEASVRPARRVKPERDAWVGFEAGMTHVGFDGDGFHFDNEGPSHRVFLEPYAIGRDLVTNGWYREFVEDGGYRRPELWLSDGWAAVQARAWEAPLYWRRSDDGAWHTFTLRGLEPLDADAPVVHLSHYEADAFARWAGARLPTETEWEHAACAFPGSPRGTLLDDGDVHAVGRDSESGDGPRHLLGEVWEWTASAYLPYPGYRPPAGALGEYNGKFMSGQMVLRGASCVTPASHVRLSYRNFFQPDKRWQMTGLRLARLLAEDGAKT